MVEGSCRWRLDRRKFVRGRVEKQDRELLMDTIFLPYDHSLVFCRGLTKGGIGCLVSSEELRLMSSFGSGSLSVSLAGLGEGIREGRQTEGDEEISDGIGVVDGARERIFSTPACHGRWHGWHGLILRTVALMFVG